MVDDIIAKIMEEERTEQMEKMKKRNESVEMMRQVTRVFSAGVGGATASCVSTLLNAARSLWRIGRDGRLKRFADSRQRTMPSTSAAPFLFPCSNLTNFP